MRFTGLELSQDRNGTLYVGQLSWAQTLLDVKGHCRSDEASEKDISEIKTFFGAV